MVIRLDPSDHAWMRAPETCAVMDALNQGGDRARFVGGCVRNALMGHPVADIDIATQLEPEASAATLEAAGIKVVPTGIEHGTLTAVVDGEPFEVTSLRRDVETFGRRAVVAFTTDWRKDAQRRDFRINAIYARPDGTLYDPFGGIEDAAKGQIVFIGDANQRIAEDHLRILRFYRFTAWYGSAVDRDGQAACVVNAGLLSRLSVERVWSELKKLLSAPDPIRVLEAMQEGHVLEHIVSGPLDFRLLLSLINRDRGKSRAPDALLRLAALLGRDEQAMVALTEKMKASNAEKGRIAAMCGPSSYAVPPYSDAPQLRAAVFESGRDAVISCLRLAEASLGDSAEHAIDVVERFDPPRFPVSGRDLIESGFERGAALGEILAELKVIWVHSDFSLGRESLIQRALELKS